MASSHQLKFSELPILVLDGIFEKLGRCDLASLSLTCRCLHHESLKYLYRGLTYFAISGSPRRDALINEKYDIFDASLQRNPTLLRYLRLHVSRSRPFLEWMYAQANPPRLERLELHWPSTGAIIDGERHRYSDFAALIPLPLRDCLREFKFEINLAVEGSMLSSLSSFCNIRSLQLRTADSPTLQDLLEQLHIPSLERLVVSNIEDWRIQWHPSFEKGFPNLRGLRVIISSEADANWVMSDNLDLEGFPTEESIWWPSNVMWDTVLRFYQRSVLFRIEFKRERRTDLFLDFASQYARVHGLDPIPLIHWRLKSVEMFDRVDLRIDTGVRIEDLITFFRALNSIALREPLEDLSVVLPPGITSAIAPLIPTSVRDLQFTLRDNEILEPSFLLACIRSLPKLHYIVIHVKLSEDNYQPSSRFTVAECYFSSLPDVGILEEVGFEIFGRRAPAWRVYGSYTEGRWRQNIEPLDRGDGVVAFEREVMDWFKWSTSLQVVQIFFSRDSRRN